MCAQCMRKDRLHLVLNRWVGLCKWLRSIHTSYKLEKREKEIGYKTSLVVEEYVYTQINVGCIWTVFCIYANGIHSI